jgi:hypothetical protein
VASPLSFLSFSFLDKIIFIAHRTPHLEYDSLPVLADYDHADHLVQRSFPHIDPAVKKVKKRHLFWGLMRIFQYDYAVLTLTIVVKVISEFAAPLGIKQLLLYIETNGKDAPVKPWVWILCLIFGPIIGSIAIQT